MILGCLLGAVLATAPNPNGLTKVVRDRFERVGRTAPQIDARLSQAAAGLAHLAATAGPQAATGLETMARELSSAGAWDANPTAIVLRATTAQLEDAVRTQPNLGTEAASAMGLGLVEAGERSAVVILLATRRIEFTSVPTSVAAGARPERVCGVLEPPLEGAEWFITRPSGKVDTLRATTRDGKTCATLGFPEPGRHTVEVLARGPKGPEVAALWFTSAGTPAEQHAAADVPEPTTDEEARAELLRRINALRVAMSLGTVQLDAALEVVAQAYARRMAEEGFFAHVAPDGSTLPQRLAASGYPFVAAGENLGQASGALAAHFGIEHSPGHRKNLLEPAHARLGLGLARVPDSRQVVLVEVLATPPPERPADPVAAALAALNDARRAAHLPPLKRSASLEALAQEHARAALALQTPRGELPGRRRPHERVFEVLEDASSAAVDVYVSQRVGAVTASKNLMDPRNDSVGVGVVIGSSEKFGPDRYWIVVIYAGFPH